MTTHNDLFKLDTIYEQKRTFLYEVKQGQLVKKNCFRQVVSWFGYFVSIVFCRQRTFLQQKCEQLFQQLVKTQGTSSFPFRITPLTQEQSYRSHRIYRLFINGTPAKKVEKLLGPNRPLTSGQKKLLLTLNQELLTNYLDEIQAIRRKNEKKLKENNGSFIYPSDPLYSSLTKKMLQVLGPTPSNELADLMKALFECALLLNTQIHTDTLNYMADTAAFERMRNVTKSENHYILKQKKSQKWKKEKKDHHRRFSTPPLLWQKVTWENVTQNCHQPFISGNRSFSFQTDNGTKRIFQIPLDLSPLGPLSPAQLYTIFEFLRTNEDLLSHVFHTEIAEGRIKVIQGTAPTGAIHQQLDKLGFSRAQRQKFLEIALNFTYKVNKNLSSSIIFI